jgi:hypothetical protein
MHIAGAHFSEFKQHVIRHHVAECVMNDSVDQIDESNKKQRKGNKTKKYQCSPDTLIFLASESITPLVQSL